MSLERDMALLARVPILAEFDAEQLRLIAFGSERRELPAGRMLFNAGDRADGGFLITDGEIALGQTERKPGIVLLPGDFIGERAVVMETRRPAKAVAVKPTTVMQIRRILFHRILNEYPELAVVVHRRLRAQMANFSEDLGRLRETLSPKT